MGSFLTTEPFLAIESPWSSQQAVWVSVLRTEYKALANEIIGLQI